MVEPVSVAELLDLMAVTHERINNLWQLFIWIHLTIMGALALLPRRIGFLERAVIIGAYLAFIYINRNAVIDAYDYLLLLKEEIAAAPIPEGALGGGLVEYWRGIDMEMRLQFLPYVHLAAGGLTTLALLLANVIGGRRD
ncbi:MAG: hypothetical protein Tsb0010_12090 [Parvularculaceae bacterium]